MFYSQSFLIPGLVMPGSHSWAPIMADGFAGVSESPQVRVQALTPLPALSFLTAASPTSGPGSAISQAST